MAKPLDNDFRKRIVGTMQAADYCRAVARRFRVAASTVSTLMKRVERTGLHARQDGRVPEAVLEEHRDWTERRVEACPATALKKLQQDLHAERGICAGEVAAGCFVRSLGSAFKKNAGCGRAGEPDGADRLGRFDEKGAL